MKPIHKLHGPRLERRQAENRKSLHKFLSKQHRPIRRYLTDVSPELLFKVIRFFALHPDLASSFSDFVKEEKQLVKDLDVEDVKHVQMLIIVEEVQES